MEAEKQPKSLKEMSPKKKARLARRLERLERDYFNRTQEKATPQSLERSELVKISARANRTLRDDGGRAIIIFDQTKEGFKIHYFLGKKYIQAGRLREKWPVVIEENSAGYNWIKLREQNGLLVLDIHAENSTFTIEPKPEFKPETFGISVVVVDLKKTADDRFETLFKFNQ